MVRVKHVFRTALLIAALPACNASVLAPEFDVTLSLEDSVVARRSQNEVSLNVFIRLRNHDNRAIYYDFCGHALQKREGNSWRAVFTPPCPRTEYSMAMFKGESRIFSFRARKPVGSGDWPDVGAAGEYRVVLWLSAIPRNSHYFAFQPLGPASRTSPAFGVREEDVASLGSAATSRSVLSTPESSRH